METPFFDSSVFELTGTQGWALAPYLWLALGVFMGTVAAGFRAQICTIRWLAALVFLPFIGFSLAGVTAPSVSLFGTSLEVDGVTRLMGGLLGIIAFLCACFSNTNDDDGRAEWFPIQVISLLGLALLPGARDWICFFVALETLAVAGYILTAIDTQREGSLEAGLKYLLMGSFASALFLMGLACLYGASGSLDYAKIGEILSGGASGRASIYALMGALLVLTSLGFKVALMPFHMWAPDVYQAAPSGLAAYLATATKLSVFVSLAVAFAKNGFFTFDRVRECLWILSSITVLAGGFLAATQTKLRRLLAYGSIVSAGNAGLLIAADAMALSSLIIYLFIYSLSFIGAYAAIVQFAIISGREAHEDVEVAELGAVARNIPGWLKFSFIVCIFSQAGIPPLPGFLGKYLILRDIWSAGDHWGTIFILLSTFIGLAYYLKVLVPLYMVSSDKPSNAALVTTTGATLTTSKRAASLVALAAALLVLASFVAFNEVYSFISANGGAVSP